MPATAAGVCPRRAWSRGGCGLARVGQRVDAPAVDLLARDEALVRELLGGGIHRAGARPPATAALGLELGDDLVAVHGLGRERAEDERPDLAPADHAASAPAAAECLAEAERPGVRSVPGVVAVASAVVAVVDVVWLEHDRVLSRWYAWYRAPSRYIATSRASTPKSWSLLAVARRRCSRRA